jgi:hypothetical protein
MPPFAQFRRQTQILILEILNVFLRLKFSPFLNLDKIEHFSKVSLLDRTYRIKRQDFINLVNPVKEVSPLAVQLRLLYIIELTR